MLQDLLMASCENMPQPCTCVSSESAIDQSMSFAVSFMHLHLVIEVRSSRAYDLLTVGRGDIVLYPFANVIPEQLPTRFVMPEGFGQTCSW